EKSFRQDLYYRLSVFPLRLPPLRERQEDIPLLVHFLVGKFASRIGKRINGIAKETMQRLVAYAWPGNVRELENVLERAVILAADSTLEIGTDVLHLPVEESTNHPVSEPAPVTDLETTQRNHILGVLKQTSGVIEGPRGAAKLLGLHPN